MWETHVIDQAGTDTTPPIVRVDYDHSDQTVRKIPVTDPNLFWRKKSVTDHSAFVNGDTRTIGGYGGIVEQQTIIEVGKRVADPRDRLQTPNAKARERIRVPLRSGHLESRGPSRSELPPADLRAVHHVFDKHPNRGIEPECPCLSPILGCIEDAKAA